MGKDKGYSGDVRILDWMIFKHLETFQHLGSIEVLPQRCRGGTENTEVFKI